MALYVAIVVEAALLTLWINQGPGERSEVHGVELVALIWGTTIGLALAHLYEAQARWAEAEQVYRLLLAEDPFLTEAEVGLAALAEK